eukprot:6692385-Prymnesium_polylepis.2
MGRSRSRCSECADCIAQVQTRMHASFCAAAARQSGGARRRPRHSCRRADGNGLYFPTVPLGLISYSTGFDGTRGSSLSGSMISAGKHSSSAATTQRMICVAEAARSFWRLGPGGQVPSRGAVLAGYYPFGH